MPDAPKPPASPVPVPVPVPAPAPDVGPDLHQVAARSARLGDEALAAECLEDFFVASGPGGQHRNKTETGVRLKHRPTGFVVVATERRSQLQNRGVALERLRERLVKAAFVPKPRRKTRPSAGARRRRVESKRRLSDRKRERKNLD